VVQDDVVFLRPDSSALGTERGFYLKTGYLEPKVQPMIYKAATSPEAIFENVLIGHDGMAYFDDETLTGNGRGIMQRQDFGIHKAKSINLKPANEVDGLIIIFITRRNTVVPLVSKLNLEQAAEAFMLGESIESSAGDPSRAGESVRGVGTNPFIIGDESYEGNWFYQFLLQNKDKVHCYLLNTGGVGEIDEKQEGRRIIKQEVVRPFIPGSSAIIRGILRDTIEWETEPYFNTTVAKKVDGIDMKKFALSNYYTEEQIDFYVRVLKIERMSWMSQFQGLDERIINFQK
jgi:phosphoenolpyruvate carboxykinase (ATP)